MTRFILKTGDREVGFDALAELEAFAAMQDETCDDVLERAAQIAEDLDVSRMTAFEAQTRIAAAIRALMKRAESSA